MSSKIALVVAYPSKDPDTGDALNFDMKYYLASHLPLIERAWGPYGLRSWSINEFPNPCPLTGQTPPYLVQTTCYFDQVEHLKAALENGSEETKPDVEKFSNVFPAIWVGEGVKQNTLAGLELEGVGQA
ncbi:hypothetical protein BU24DRAFT_428159 [Aaosphaeria arxii CBS 175.79]|uniref:EthD domain-containing protein n=1 Tax=Aaosphaeria arxii CBS 175.79 TaxID=1450172 RepID=A0A6A5XAX0_9PLEO|nr:uncharacterized protein BU24DRAFT_428159 [Aaosphaeria arxii CBS 175.79]KAF2010128.1 hypothetical protein BU24DRAFT_428159 [Aaosphaeria arxii CBS 175.79]